MTTILIRKIGNKDKDFRKHRMKKKPLCLQCRSSEQVVKIVYGLPRPEAMVKAKKGEIKLGGCVVSDNDPQWFCKKCQRKF